MNSSGLPEREVLYVADPLCTWCWGFAPASRELAQAVRGRAGFRVLPGGLSLDPGAPLGNREVATMLEEWRRVHATTGQPFDFDHPVDTTTVFDSGPPCRALAMVGRIQPQQALPYLHALQRAFFAERRDLSDPVELAAIATACGVTNDGTPAALASRLSGDAADEAFHNDQFLGQALNLRAFPAVALRSEQRYTLLTLGYRSWPELAPHVQSWLEQG